MNSLVLVPSATHIPSELQGDFGRIPSCMIPFGGAPALQQIVMEYPEAEKVVVASHASSEWIDEYLANCDLGHAIAIDVGPTRSLGETVIRALQRSGGWRGHLIVHFGDTLAPGISIEGDTFLFATPDDLFRWTTFNIDSRGYLESIFDKGTEKVGDGKVFVGVFSIVDAAKFQEYLEIAVMNSKCDLDPFYQALMCYYNGLDQPPTITETKHWVDLGHLDTYYASRLDRAMGQRSFNTVNVDANRGILTKRSLNEDKFYDEIQWYLTLPARLQYLAPRIFNHSLVPGDLWIEMEYYGYPPLTDVYLFSRLDISEWKAIFKSVHLVLDDLRGHRLIDEEPDVVSNSLKNMYQDKTLDRLDSLKEGGLKNKFMGRPIEINGRLCLSLEECIDGLPAAIEASGLLDPVPLCAIHGDFCLSNILFDRRSRAIRLVDPRGRFGTYQGFGDPRYDLAKLSHCFNGGYDFLVHGLFSVERVGEAKFNLKLFMDARHVAVRDQFNRTFLSSPQLFSQVRGIEALLFLSMVPLHADRPLAQEAFLLRGLELASEFLSDGFRTAMGG